MKIANKLKVLLLMLCMVLIVGCGAQNEDVTNEPTPESEYSVSTSEETEKIETETPTVEEESETELVDEDTALSQEPDTTENKEVVNTGSTFNVSDIPEYSGNAYVAINNNVPYFDDSELSETSYENYSDLDSLGRCGICIASVGQDIMPTEERGSIGSVKPTGWQTIKYSGIVDGNYLYNRCHLIGFQLTGENANTKNLITGTRYMNVDGMLPFENMVADYVKETGNHVMYRVTPIFEGNNLVANGVLIEAKSVEDNGKGILFNVFCYNVQPGVTIDYATGNSTLDGSVVTQENTNPVSEETTVSETSSSVDNSSASYAVNGNNGKIHMVGGCAATGNGGSAMSNPVYFNTYEEAEAYSIQIAPLLDKRQCGNCW